MSKLPKPTQNDLLPFSKIFYSSPNYIKNEILIPAYYNLKEYLHETELEEQSIRLSGAIIVSETPYIKMALKNIEEELKAYPDIQLDKEKALQLLTEEEKKEIFKDSYSNAIKKTKKVESNEKEKIVEKKKMENKNKKEKENKEKEWVKEMEAESKRYQKQKLLEGGFEPAFSDDEDLSINNEKIITVTSKKNKNSNDSDEYVFNDYLLETNKSYEIIDDNNENDIDVLSTTSSTTTKVKKESHTKEDQELNESKSNKSDKKEKGKLISTPPTSDDENMYYFYQSTDGQHYYLHPICNKILKYEFKEYSNFPDTIECNILNIEESTINKVK